MDQESIEGSETNQLSVKLATGFRLPAEEHHAVELLCADRPAAFILLRNWASRYNKALPDGSRQITAFLLPGDMLDT